MGNIPVERGTVSLIQRCSSFWIPAQEWGGENRFDDDTFDHKPILGGIKKKKKKNRLNR